MYKKSDHFINKLIIADKTGTQIVLESNTKKKELENFNKILLEQSDQHDKLIDEIDFLIDEIRKLVISVEPLELLNYWAGMFKLSFTNLSSEYGEQLNNFVIVRMAEYVQSILISTKFDGHITEKIHDKAFFYEIHSKIEILFEKIKLFYFSWKEKLSKDNPEIDEKDLIALFEAQYLFGVRGNRYQCFEREYHNDLLYGHDEIFQKLFNLTAQEIIDGIEKIEYSLSQAQWDKFNKLRNLFNELEKSNEDLETFKEKKLDESLSEELFGVGLYDVLEQTCWNKKFVAELSVGIGENTSFFTKDKYAGWPIIDLPIKYKPFIRINEKYYCFNYYNFVDNIYRAIQKVIRKLSPSYKWSDIQQNLSEKKVENIFKQLLPGCKTYMSNYYPIVEDKKKNYAENDLIVIYDNILFVVEVKAGSFVFTSPINDFLAHIESYQNLIERANIQCARTATYLRSSSIALLLDKHHSTKAKIDMDKIEDIYMISVTMDNINSFATKAEKLSFLNLKCDAISIAIDDLMVYREYFDYPTQFLHFLSQRRLAIQNNNLILNDELDHLGMYIAHNYYNFQTDDVSKGERKIFYGYRQELDKYFTSLYHTNLKVPKPVQKIPDLFLKIIDYLEKNRIQGRTQLVKYLLDFSTYERENFCNQISDLIKIQKQFKEMRAMDAIGQGDELRYTCIVYQKGISQIENQNILNHVYTKIIWHEEDERKLIIFHYDEKDAFESVEFRVCKFTDIEDEKRAQFEFWGEKEARLKLERYQKENKKIRRNELCPCGSRKEYKKCCRNRKWKYF